MRIAAGCLVSIWLISDVIGGPAVSGQSLKNAGERRLPSFDVTEKTIEDLQQAMQAGKVTSRELVESYLARIAAYDSQGPALNAIVALNPKAREMADALDSERSARGRRSPLHGIPILVKDNYETIEMPTSAGSIALASFHPRRDAFQVQRLKAAGAVILAKTNMHELAAGIVTVGSRFGRSKNPYDLDRNPGGSSGGTGAAVAASFAAAGMGSDTCGSIRVPAGHNNLVGLRPTQGLSSRRGIVPLSSTQDIGGPLARTIPDLAIMLDATVGADAADAATSASAGQIPPSYRAGLRADALKGARLGIVRSLFGAAPEDAEVSTVIQRALDSAKKAGAETIDVVIPGLDELLRDSSMILFDFKFDLAEYLAQSENPPVRSLGEILDHGLFHSALESTFRMRNAVEGRDTEASRRARIKQTAIRHAAEAVLAEHRLTALVYPTIRRKPSRIGETQAPSNCQLSSHSGLPALSVPAGFTDDDVPVGMDLLGGAFKEQDLLSLGFSIEQELRLRRTPFSTPPLIAGMRPRPRVTTLSVQTRRVNSTGEGGIRAAVNLSYDEALSRLDYVMRIDAAGRDELSAVWIHRGTPEKPGAARHLMYVPSQSTSGSVILSAADRKDIASGTMLLRFFVRDHPGSAGDALLTLKAMGAP
jgi:Asp-tRNA(Asn)/Glu-tRNA(Gln) amidotransferase A subunit family amidase